MKRKTRLLPWLSEVLDDEPLGEGPDLVSFAVPLTARPEENEMDDDLDDDFDYDFDDDFEDEFDDEPDEEEANDDALSEQDDFGEVPDEKDEG